MPTNSYIIAEELVKTVSPERQFPSDNLPYACADDDTNTLLCVLLELIVAAKEVLRAREREHIYWYRPDHRSVQDEKVSRSGRIQAFARDELVDNYKNLARASVAIGMAAGSLRLPGRRRPPGQCMT